LQSFSKGGAALSPEMRDDAMGRQHRERKPDKARCRSDARNTFPEHLPLLLELAVPLGFEEPAADREFMRRVTDRARTRDLRSHNLSKLYCR
jgi:hypothetical protein